MLQGVRTHRQQRLRDALFLSVGVVGAGLALIAYGLGFLNNFERQSVDARFSIRGTQSQPKDVIVVGIDTQTFTDLNIRWPFPRSLHAKVIDGIERDKPLAIAYDVQFSEFSPVAEDNALGLALQRHPNSVVLSTTAVDANTGEPDLIFSASDLKAIGARAGHGQFPPEPGGVIRHFVHAIDGLKTLSIATAEIALHRQIKRSELGSSEPWIDYRGPGGTISAVSFSRVLRGQVPKGMFHDKVVVIGATDPTLQDVHPTPVSSSMPGPEIQANAVWTALHGFPLQSTPTWLNLLLIVVLGLLAPAISLRLSLFYALPVAVLVGAVFVVGTQIAFNTGHVVSFVYPLTALTLSTIGALVNYYVVEAFERERVRDVFSRFVPESIVDQVLAQAGSDLRLGGKELTATVMFSDLRGFTSSAEHLSAEEVIIVLNSYLGDMSDAILDHGGTLISYMGDGIYAIFGAPIEMVDHADRALAAAREMVDVRLPRFNEWMRTEGYGQGYLMGVGLNTGSIMCGNVGHERRVDYTAVGDTVNTASRIEGETKGSPYSLLVSETTFEILTSPPPDLTYYEEVEIRGRLQKLKLWGAFPKPVAPA
jgi:adenylate cyclase